VKIRGLILAAALATSILPAHAQAPADAPFPSRPVRFITPFAPGGGTDIVARAVGRKLAEMWGQPVVVDNRPGAETIIATDLAVKSPADGYTLLLASASFSTNPSVHRKLPYDSLKDFAAITQTALEPYVLVVHPSLPVRTVKEFIAYAQANPAALNYGAGGTQNHLAVELFKMLTRTQMVYVPYRGTSLALTDLLGGQIQCLFVSVVAAGTQLKSGRLRSLAVTSARRSTVVPELPTITEAGGPEFDVSAWNGVLVPAGVPAPIAARLNRDIVAALLAPDVRDKLAAGGAEPVGSSAAEFARFIRTEIATWAKVVESAGLRPD
jgi:tripartite-type tricarboxylate transporter receptor subunit TctC